MTPDDPTGRYLFEGEVYIVKRVDLPDGSPGFGAFREGGNGTVADNSLEIMIEGQRLRDEPATRKDVSLLRGNEPSKLKGAPREKSFTYVSQDGAFLSAQTKTPK